MAAAATERRPRIAGIVGYSVVDYPGRASAVLFVQGCAWRCRYCHNPHLQPRTRSGGGWDEARSLIERRRGLLDAIVFSGGEPTSDPALRYGIDEARSAGYEIGLHTAGVHPKRLAEVVEDVDWVGFDVKAPFEDYERVTGVPDSGRPARQALVAAMRGARSLEVRTTYHPALLQPDDVRQIARSVSAIGVRRFALQAFRGLGCTDAALNASAGLTRPPADLIAELDAMFPAFEYREDA